MTAPPMARYGNSYVYAKPPVEERNAMAEAARARRLETFSPDQFVPRPSDGDHDPIVRGPMRLPVLIAGLRGEVAAACLGAVAGVGEGLVHQGHVGERGGEAVAGG